MKRLPHWSLASASLMAVACTSGGGGLSSGSNSTTDSDPRGDWVLALVVSAGTGDGAGAVSSGHLYTAEIRAAAGSKPYELLLNESAGGPSTLRASVEGDQLHLSGSMAWEGPSSSGTANVLSSAISIRDSILFGTLDVALTGGASGSETWLLSAYAPPDLSGLPAIGWWRLHQEVVYASGVHAATMGDTAETILFVGPYEFLQYVVGWWQSDGVWAGVATFIGTDKVSLIGWSREHSDAGMTWLETMDAFQVDVDVEGDAIEENVIQLVTSGDQVGEQYWRFTGTRVAPGTSLGPPSAAGDELSGLDETEWRTLPGGGIQTVRRTRSSHSGR